MSARPRRRGLRIAAVVVLLGAIAVVTRIDVGGRDEPADGADTASEPVATAEVVETDLVQRTSVDGTLGYATLDEQVVGRGSGTITGLAAEGAVMGRGGALYHVDGRPVTLLLGGQPAHRTLQEGDEGADVRQLKENLVVLGYATWDQIDDDDEFGSGTRKAVKRWQEALGVEETGVVQLGDVVVLPGPVRIQEHQVEVGSVLQDGTPVATLASLGRVVSVDLDADKADLVSEGDPVEVELPDGSVAQGTVSSVASTVDVPAEEDGDPTVAVTITLDDAPPGAEGLDHAPVEVRIESARREGVLAVPVPALLALAEGGYGIERVTDGHHELVAVEPGMADDDRDLIEVTSDELRAGDTVVVAQ